MYPPYPRYQPPPTPPNPHKRRDFLISLGLGLIPGIVASIGIGAAFHPQPGLDVATYALWAGAILYVVTLIASIVLISNQQTRSYGAGLLTGWVIDPVIFSIACVVALSHGPVI